MSVRVVLADDESIIRMDLKEMLTSLGYVVVGEAGDGKSAVNQARQLRPDLVIMDIQMPELDAVGVTALLRARPDAVPVPIIVVTASGGPHEWQLLSSLGADRFLVKPVNLDDLISTIRRALRERSSGNFAIAG